MSTAKFVTARKPQCPICRCELQDQCFYFVDDIAYCTICSTIQHAGLHAVTSRLWSHLVQTGWTTEALGLQFLTPPASDRSKHAVHLEVEKRYNPNVKIELPRTGIDADRAKEWTDDEPTTDDRDQT